MNWKFWQKKPLVVAPDVEKERLVRLRSALLDAAYNMRLADLICSRYFAKTTDSLKVKNLLWEWYEKVDINQIWSQIAEVEDILRTKYGTQFQFLDASKLEDVRFDLLATNLKRAELSDDGNNPTYGSGIKR